MKFRDTVTTVKEYEIGLDAEYYPKGTTEDEALKIEQEAAEDDPFLYTEGGDTTVKVERID